MIHVHWVENNILAAGGCPFEKGDLEVLHENGIRAVLTLTEFPILNHAAIIPEYLTALDLKVFHFPIMDQYPPKPENLDTPFQFIEEMKAEGRPVYMHCLAGIGRTGTMLHVYLMRQGMSLDEAKRKIAVSKPTSHFVRLTDPQQAFLEQFANHK